MQTKLGIIAAALSVVLFSSTLALAQPAKAAKASGTVVVVEKEVVQIKAADGKTYQAGWPLPAGWPLDSASQLTVRGPMRLIGLVLALVLALPLFNAEGDRDE